MDSKTLPKVFICFTYASSLNSLFDCATVVIADEVPYGILFVVLKV